MKKSAKLALMVSCVVLTSAYADSYVYYDSVKDAVKSTDDKKWVEVLSYKYAKSKLIIIGENGKKIKLQDGVYEFDNGAQYVVKDNKAVPHKKAKQQKKDKKKKAKDKLKKLF